MAKTHFTIDIPHRQYAEALRDALHLWITNEAHGGAQADTHPMKQFVTAVRDELSKDFVEANA